MSQIIYITGQVQQKGALRQSESNPDTSYLRFILQETSGKSKNELPIVSFNANAQKVNDKLTVGSYIIAECRVSSSKNVKDDHTWYNISLILNDFKILAKSSDFEKITKNDIRSVAKSTIKSDNNKQNNTDAQVSGESHKPSKSNAENDAIKKQEQKITPSSDNTQTESQVNVTTDDSDGFDESLFDFGD